jgi:riboflavin kinase/FMN adenylyltransferase
MRVFSGSEALGEAVAGCVLTVGNFDGLHLGHQALISAVTTRAAELGRPAVVYTFDPHPRRLLYPDRAPELLMSWEQLEEALERAGIDFLIREPFTQEFAALTAEAFLANVIAERIAPSEVFVGRAFHFGKGRAGSGETLVELAPSLGIRAEVISQVATDGVDVSSTRVRGLLGEGEVELARRCLGRPYAIRGAVGHGDQRGRSLGFPTANIDIQNELIPEHGVYATVVELLDADAGAPREYPSVTNIGTRPTFAASQVRVEAHLLDFDGDLYGQRVELRFHARIRDERRLSGPEELSAQITADVDRARAILSSQDS